MDGDKLEWALRWAHKGFKIFPLRPGTKKPAFDGWPEAATADPDQLRAWWAQRDYNIGVLTDDLVVVDIDVKKGKPGLESFAALDLSFDDQDTLMVEQPSGGRHAYYSGPNRSLSAKGLGEGLDIRSYHGYVVGPGSYVDSARDPSVTVDGYYTILNDAPVRAVPREILSRLDAPIDRGSLAPVVQLDTPAAVESATFFLAAEAPPAVEGQGGDLATLKAALWCKDLGLSQDMTAQIMQEHYNPRCFPPWDVEELTDKVANAYAYGSKPPGSDSPEAAFRGVSIPAIEPSNVIIGPWMRHGQARSQKTRWLYHDLIPADGVGVVTAPSQAGKTFVLIELSRCTATGKPFFGVVPDDLGGTVFLFAGSEGSGFEDRLAALQEEGPLPISGLITGFLGERGGLTRALDLVREEAARMQQAFGVPLRMVVLETLSASGLLPQEDDNAMAAQAMQNLAMLGQHLGVPVFTSHHPPKSGTGSRGAGAITNNADTHIEIVRNGEETVRVVHLRKARNAPQRRLGAFTLLPVELGEDDRGRKIISMAVSSGGSLTTIGDWKASHSALVVECVEWTCIDDAVMIDGREAAPFDDVRALFKDRKPGGKDKSNVAKVWNASLKHAVDSGAVEDLAFNGERYLRKREIA